MRKIIQLGIISILAIGIAGCKNNKVNNERVTNVEIETTVETNTEITSQVDTPKESITLEDYFGGIKGELDGALDSLTSR